MIYAMDGHEKFDLLWRIEKPNRNSVEVLYLTARHKQSGLKGMTLQYSREELLFEREPDKLLKITTEALFGNAWWICKV